MIRVYGCTSRGRAEVSAWPVGAGAGRGCHCVHVSNFPVGEIKLSKATKPAKATKQGTPPRPPGRPSDYSRKIALEICKRLGLGEGLRQICASPEMPGKTTVMRWLEAHLEFREQYARARELQAEHWAEEIIEIADDSRNDFVEKENRDGSTYEALNSENINRSRLRVDTRKWLMARPAPKKYGDKVTTALVGDPENPVHSQHTVIVEFVESKDGKPA